jgi:hypothetical protein
MASSFLPLGRCPGEAHRKPDGALGVPSASVDAEEARFFRPAAWVRHAPEKGGGMYIGIGTVLLIVLIILLIVFLA